MKALAKGEKLDDKTQEKLVKHADAVAQEYKAAETTEEPK